MTPWVLVMLRRYWMQLTLATALLVSYNLWASKERVLGAARERVTLLTGELSAETHRADSLGKAYRVDTLRLAHYTTRWDTAYASVWAHDTLTLTRTDTVRVPVATLRLADSTVRACRAVLQDCGIRIAAESTLAAHWKMKALIVPEGPSVLSRVLKFGAALGAGVVLARVWH